MGFFFILHFKNYFGVIRMKKDYCIYIFFNFIFLNSHREYGEFKHNKTHGLDSIPPACYSFSVRNFTIMHHQQCT